MSILEAISPTARELLNGVAVGPVPEPKQIHFNEFSRAKMIDSIMALTGDMKRPEKHRRYLEQLSDDDLFARLETMRREAQ